MEKREISKELYDAVMDYNSISFKLMSLIEKEKKEDFWAKLDKEIDRAKEVRNYAIGFWCNYHQYRLDLKWLAMFHDIEKQKLIESWKRSPLQFGYYEAVVSPLTHIMKRKREDIDRRCNDRGDSFYTEIKKLC